jgi:hypothetical protein
MKYEKAHTINSSDYSIVFKWALALFKMACLDFEDSVSLDYFDAAVSKFEVAQNIKGN